MSDPLPTNFLRAIHRKPALHEPNLPNRTSELSGKRPEKPEGQNAAVRPQLEPSPERGALRETGAQKEDSGRFLVRVTSVRSRLLDEDNLCEKYVVDCCRYAGLLPSDSPAKTRIETTQRKVEGEESEKTIVEIFELTNPETI